MVYQLGSIACPHCVQLHAISRSLTLGEEDLLQCGRCGSWFAIGGEASPTRKSSGSESSSERLFDSLDLDGLDAGDAIAIRKPSGSKVSSNRKQSAPPPAPQGNQPNSTDSSPSATQKAINADPAQASGNPAAESKDPAPPTVVPPPFVPPTAPSESKTYSPLAAKGASSSTEAASEHASGRQGAGPDRQPTEVSASTAGDRAVAARSQTGNERIDNSEMEEVAAAALEVPTFTPDELELLDDEALFKSLDHRTIDGEDAVAVEAFLSNPSTQSTSKPLELLSIRCRVCDTLQYVELRPGKTPKCEICFSPLQVPIKVATPTPPAHVEKFATPKVTSPEAFGTAVAGHDRPLDDDEVSQLVGGLEPADAIISVSNETDSSDGPDVMADTAEDADGSTFPADSELRLAPLEDDSAKRFDTLWLDQETKSMLQARSDATDQPTPIQSTAADEIEEAQADDLVPLEDSLEHESVDDNDGVNSTSYFQTEKFSELPTSEREVSNDGYELVLDSEPGSVTFGSNSVSPGANTTQNLDHRARF